MEKSSVSPKELTKDENPEQYQYVTQAKTCSYPAEIGHEIIDRMLAGESVLSISQDAHMPPANHIFWWFQGKTQGGAADVLSDNYAQARAARAERIGETVLFLVEDQASEKPTRAHQNARVAGDMARWVLGRMSSPRWAEPTQHVQHSGTVTLSHVLEQVREQSGNLLSGARGRVIEGKAEPVADK